MPKVLLRRPNQLATIAPLARTREQQESIFAADGDSVVCATVPIPPLHMAPILGV